MKSCFDYIDDAKGVATKPNYCKFWARYLLHHSAKNNPPCVELQCYTQKEKGKKRKRAAEKVNCKHLNNTQGELQSRPFSFLVPFLSSPHRLFSTKAVIRRKCAVSGKEKRRENNYPLPQPAGLFINTQL